MTSVAAVTPWRSAASDAARLSVVMAAVAAATASAGASPAFSAVAMTPVPSGFVSTSAWPARPRAFVRMLRGVDEAGDRVAELDLRVAHRVSAEERAAGVPQGEGAAAHDRRRPLRREVPLGERGDRERGERPSAHRVHVGERVRRGDAAEGLGVVHDRREEVDRLHEGRSLVEEEDAGVVARRVVDEDAGVVRLRQGAQDLGELGGAELARSTRAGDPLGEPPDPLALVGHRKGPGPRRGAASGPRRARARRSPRAARPCGSRPGRRPRPRRRASGRRGSR